MERHAEVAEGLFQTQACLSSALSALHVETHDQDVVLFPGSTVTPQEGQL